MNKIRDFARQVKRKFKNEDHHYLSELKGVIHVGANLGQEKELYRHYNLHVIWVEPIADIFEQLNRNVKHFSRQKTLQYLITDQDEQSYKFNIASNDGQSSSILELNQHRDIWPNVDFIDEINLSSITLKSMVDKEKIDMKKYDFLVMDTQGSELLVLKGAESMLQHFKYILTEAADFEMYKNGCRLDDINRFLGDYNFKPVLTQLIAQREQGGGCYNVLYKNSV